MTKTGQIVQIVPDGGYQSQNGYINTFQMTIQCQDGTFTGQIGSKSEIYPLGIGETINVDMANTQHGVRFKKFNPQYAQAGQGQQPYNQPTQAATGRPTASSAAKPAPQGVNPHDLSIERQCAAKSACNYCGLSGKPAENIVPIAIELAYFMKTGNNFTNIPEAHPDITDQAPITNPGYVGDDPPPPPDDGIPY